MTALAVNAILGFKTMPMIALLSPALPDSASVASSALALYKALEASYPNMPQEEQRLLRHTMLDQTRPWQAKSNTVVFVRSSSSQCDGATPHFGDRMARTIQTDEMKAWPNASTPLHRMHW